MRLCISIIPSLSPSHHPSFSLPPPLPPSPLLIPAFLRSSLPISLTLSFLPSPNLHRTTFNSLQNIITNFPSWRHDVARVFAQFILQDIPDSCPLVLEAALKMLIQMITHWRALIATEADKQVCVRCVGGMVCNICGVCVSEVQCY